MDTDTRATRGPGRRALQKDRLRSPGSGMHPPPSQLQNHMYTCLWRFQAGRPLAQCPGYCRLRPARSQGLPQTRCSDFISAEGRWLTRLHARGSKTRHIPRIMIHPRMMWYFIAPWISFSSSFSTPALLRRSCSRRREAVKQCRQAGIAIVHGPFSIRDQSPACCLCSRSERDATPPSWHDQQPEPSLA